MKNNYLDFSQRIVDNELMPKLKLKLNKKAIIGISVAVFLLVSLVVASVTVSNLGYSFDPRSFALYVEDTGGGKYETFTEKEYNEKYGTDMDGDGKTDVDGRLDSGGNYSSDDKFKIGCGNGLSTATCFCSETLCHVNINGETKTFRRGDMTTLDDWLNDTLGELGGNTVWGSNLNLSDNAALAGLIDAAAGASFSNQSLETFLSNYLENTYLDNNLPIPPELQKYLPAGVNPKTPEGNGGETTETADQYFKECMSSGTFSSCWTSTILNTKQKPTSGVFSDYINKFQAECNSNPTSGCQDAVDSLKDLYFNNYPPTDSGLTQNTPTGSSLVNNQWQAWYQSQQSAQNTNTPADDSWQQWYQSQSGQSSNTSNDMSELQSECRDSRNLAACWEIAQRSWSEQRDVPDWLQSYWENLQESVNSATPEEIIYTNPLLVAYKFGNPWGPAGNLTLDTALWVTLNQKEINASLNAGVNEYLKLKYGMQPNPDQSPLDTIRYYLLNKSKQESPLY